MDKRIGDPKVALYGLFVALLPWIAVGFASPQSLTASPVQTLASAHHRLVFLITASREGYLQPCGCSPGQKDVGLAVEASNIRDIRDDYAKTGDDVLLIDAGHFAASDHSGTETIARAFHLLHYACVHLTEQDERFDPTASRVLQENDVPYIGAAHPDHAVVTAGQGVNKPLSVEVSALSLAPALPVTSRRGIDAQVSLTELKRADIERILATHQGATPELVVIPYTFTPTEERAGSRLVVSAPQKEVILECVLDLATHRFTKVATIQVQDDGKRDKEIDRLVIDHFTSASNLLQGHSRLPQDFHVSFQSASTCQGCHHEAFDSWQKGPHATALKTLIAAKRLVPECLPCHDLAYRETGQFNPASPVTHESVTCAACHGDGTRHTVTMKRADVQVNENKEFCIRCHTSEVSPGFNYATALSKIHH